MPETVVHFQIRMPPTLHQQLAGKAKDEKLSLNALVVGILEGAVASRRKTPGSSTGDSGPSARS